MDQDTGKNICDPICNEPVIKKLKKNLVNGMKKKETTQ